MHEQCDKKHVWMDWASRATSITVPISRKMVRKGGVKHVVRLDSVSPWCVYVAGINYTFLSINHFIYNLINICNQLKILITERTPYTYAKTQECITCFRNYLYCF